MQAPSTLGDYWEALYARKWLVLAVMLTATVCAAGISLWLPPLYEAKASFFVPSNVQAPTYVGPGGQRSSQTILKATPDEREAGLVIGVLKSRDLAARVLQGFAGLAPDFLTKNVDFSASPQFFVDIYVRGADPRLAAEVANAYVDAYRDFHSEKLRASAQQTGAVLEQQLASLTRRVAERTSAIREYQKRHRLLSEGETEQRYVSRMKDIERQLDDVAVAIAAQQVRLGRGGERTARDDVVTNPAVESIARLQARQAGLRQQLEQMRNESAGTISSISELQLMVQERRTLQEMLATVEVNLAEARVQAESAQAQIVSVQRAQPPAKSAFPLAWLNGGVGAVLGLVAGCYLALVLGYASRMEAERARRRLEHDLFGEPVA